MSGPDERDDRCPECGQRRHRFHAPSLPSTRLPRWVFLGVGVMFGAFGALISTSIGAEPKASDTTPTSLAPPPSVAESRPGETQTSAVSSTTTPRSTSTSTTSTTTTSSTTTTVPAPTDPPTTPPGANVAVTITTTTTTTTTTLAPQTAAPTSSVAAVP